MGAVHYIRSGRELRIYALDFKVLTAPPLYVSVLVELDLAQLMLPIMITSAETNPSIIIYPGRWQSLKTICWSMLAATSLIFINLYDPSSHFFLNFHWVSDMGVSSFIVIFMFVAFGLIELRNLGIREPILVLDDEGLICSGFEKIPWGNIDEVCICSGDLIVFRITCLKKNERVAQRFYRKFIPGWGLRNQLEFELFSWSKDCDIERVTAAFKLHVPNTIVSALPFWTRLLRVFYRFLTILAVMAVGYVGYTLVTLDPAVFQFLHERQ